MKTALKKAKSVIHKLQENIILYYNQIQIFAPVFQPGDKIYLNSANIHTIHSLAKLLYQYCESYIVEKQVEFIAYQLKLLLSLRRLHLVFNIIKLTITATDSISSRYIKSFQLYSCKQTKRVESQGEFQIAVGIIESFSTSSNRKTLVLKRTEFSLRIYFKNVCFRQSSRFLLTKFQYFTAYQGYKI